MILLQKCGDVAVGYGQSLCLSFFEKEGKGGERGGGKL
jgi:hypothetical protein